MSFFDMLFKKQKTTSMVSYSGYQSYSAPFTKECWYHDTFRATVDAIASHAAKGQFQAVVTDKDGRIQKILRNDPMTRLLNLRPNDVMGGTEFKYRMIANLETKTTAVAYILWDGAKPKAVYPVDFTRYEFKKIIGGGYAIEFDDYDGVRYALPLTDCIVLRKFYNDRVASGDGNQPIYKVLDMSKASDEGFIESLQVSNKVHGILKQKMAMLDPADVKKKQEEFTGRLIDSAKNGGVVAVDSMEEYVPLNITANAANAAQMQQINNRIYTYLRTPESIVQNKYSETEGMAWHEGKIEPIWHMFAEAVTSAYFTRHEIECGNKIVMTGGVMTGISMQSITQILSVTRDTGELTINERRELLGYAPVEGGDIREVSLNYVSADKQDEYQELTAEGESNGKEENKSETA